MDFLITLFCIFGLCVFVYAYVKMHNLKKNYYIPCKVLYIPEDDINNSLNTRVIDHETHENKFKHTLTDTAPRGISEIDDIIPTL